MDLYNADNQEVLERISRHCPESLWAYIQCVNRANSDNSVFFSKEMVEVDMSEQMGKFKKAIKKLALENLLEWHPIDDGIQVILAIDNDAGGFCE